MCTLGWLTVPMGIDCYPVESDKRRVLSWWPYEEEWYRSLESRKIRRTEKDYARLPHTICAGKITSQRRIETNFDGGESEIQYEQVRHYPGQHCYFLELFFRLTYDCPDLDR